MKAIFCERLVDGLGAMSESPSVILIDGDRISDVLPRDQYPNASDAEEIRLDGATLLPGLIDLHVHLRGLPERDWRPEAFASEGLRAARATNDLRLLIEAGFTTVRDCGSTISLALREAVNEGTVPGPRILAAGLFVERTGGTDDASIFLPLDLARLGYGQSAVRLADGPDEVRKAVREQVRAGADLIKTCADGMGDGSLRQRRDTLEWTTAEMDALVDEAHRLGRRVAVHAMSTAAVLQAVASGADTIEHGYWLEQTAIEEMARRRTYLVPTLASLQITASRGAEYGMPEWLTSGAAEIVESHRSVVQEAYRAGVPIAMGSDCTGTRMYPFGKNVAEVEAMVDAGIPPMDAIVASTYSAAQACGLESVGSLTPGSFADIIAVPGDPIREPQVLREVSFVMKAGHVIEPVRAMPRESQSPSWLR